MLYEDLMLDTSTKIRYKMFRLLTTLKPDHYSIFFLAEKLNLTYQQTYHHLNELNREIQLANPKQDSILIKNSGITTLNIILTLDDYRYQLLEESLPFSFVQYSLQEDNPTLDDFCTKMYVSRSTLSRKMKPLTTFLKQFNIRISYTTMALVGEENKVRQALFYLMWLGTRGIVWPFNFKKEELSFLKENFKSYFSLNQTFVGKKELDLMLGISYSRMKKNFYAPYHTAYDLLFKKSDYYDLTLLDHVPTIPLKCAKGECAHFYFMSLMAPYFTETKDPVLSKRLSAFAKDKNMILSLGEEFLTYINEEIFQNTLTKGEKQIALGNILSVTFAFYVINGPFPHLRIFISVDDDKNTALTRGCEAFFSQIEIKEKYEKLKTVFPNLMEAYGRFLQPYYEKRKKKDPLKVALALEQNILYTHQLQSFLENLNFVKVETYMNRPESYDLIIASSFTLKLKYPKAPLYYWDLDFKEEELIYLYQLLQEKYQKKNEEK